MPWEDDTVIVKRIVVGVIGTNCYVAYNEGSDRCVLVDPGDDVQKIKDRLDGFGVKPAVILLTHGHFDHIWAVPGITAAYPDVKIYAGRGEDALLHDPELNCTARGHNPMTVNADRLLDDNEEFEAAGLRFTTLAVPGHTAGSVCYYDRENGILFSGDTLFCGSMGRTDLPTGDERAIFESLVRLRLLPDETCVYPGHADTTTIGAEKKTNPYFRESIF